MGHLAGPTAMGSSRGWVTIGKEGAGSQTDRSRGITMDQPDGDGMTPSLGMAAAMGDLASNRGPSVVSGISLLSSVQQ